MGSYFFIIIFQALTKLQIWIVHQYLINKIITRQSKTTCTSDSWNRLYDWLFWKCSWIMEINKMILYKKAHLCAIFRDTTKKLFDCLIYFCVKKNKRIGALILITTLWLTYMFALKGYLRNCQKPILGTPNS